MTRNKSLLKHMKKTLFLYLDILGFKLLSASPEKVRSLFEILDSCSVHRNSNFKTVVFSDTLIAFNSATDLSPRHMRIELMFLIEFVHDITHRLTGLGIAFRAIIRFGEFEYAKLNHIEAYFGKALIASHEDEKSELPATGLFLHDSVISHNDFFPAVRFSDAYHFSFLAYDLARVSRDYQDAGYPLPPLVTMWSEAQIEDRVLFQIHHLREIYDGTFHDKPSVRSKYLMSWSMYESTYPNLVKALTTTNFDPASLCNIDWSEAQEKLRKRITSSHDQN
jgi:hypothetical protein